jgi:hypothetical protein
VVSTAFVVRYIFLETFKNTCLRARSVLDPAISTTPHPLPVSKYYLCPPFHHILTLSLIFICDLHCPSLIDISCLSLIFLHYSLSIFIVNLRYLIPRSISYWIIISITSLLHPIQGLYYISITHYDIFFSIQFALLIHHTTYHPCFYTLVLPFLY